MLAEATQLYFVLNAILWIRVNNIHWMKMMENGIIRFNRAVFFFIFTGMRIGSNNLWINYQLMTNCHTINIYDWMIGVYDHINTNQIFMPTLWFFRWVSFTEPSRAPLAPRNIYQSYSFIIQVCGNDEQNVVIYLVREHTCE